MDAQETHDEEVQGLPCSSSTFPRDIDLLPSFEIWALLISPPYLPRLHLLQQYSLSSRSYFALMDVSCARSKSTNTIALLRSLCQRFVKQNLSITFLSMFV
jgi:hypothetical protein